MKRNIIITIISTIILLGISNNSASALTYSNNVDLEYTFAPTLDVSFSSNTGFVIEDLTPGAAADSNIVTVTASSNNSDGFTLAATAGKSSDSYRNNNRLVHSNNTNYFESIATNANTTLDNLGTNKWGYSVCTVVTNNTCSTWSNYNGLPAVGNTGTELVETNSAGSTSVDMKIGASSTNTQVSGTFTNDINFTITAKVVTYDYAITYDGNGSGDTVSNVPTGTSGSLQTGQTLLASNQIPTRTGYDFLGWCDSTITGATCDGKLYSPNDYIKFTNPQGNATGDTNNIALSAVWLRYIQDLTLDLCTKKATSNPYIVYDRRDETPYHVQKLADNKCWLLDNLSLDLTNQTIVNSLNEDNTNASNATLAYLKGVTTRNPDTDANGQYATAGLTYSEWTRGQSYSAPLISSSLKDDSNTNDALSEEAKTWKYGVYYNYCAASAGSYCYGNGESYGTSIGDATEDICPKGWRMPTGGANGEYNTLRNSIAYNSATDYRNILHLPESGYVDKGAKKYQGNFGRWFASTRTGNGTMNSVGLQNSYINSDRNNLRHYGFSVRCVRTS